MNMTHFADAIQSLTPALRSLANAQARVTSAEQHKSVQAYLVTEHPQPPAYHYRSPIRPHPSIPEENTS